MRQFCLTAKLAVVPPNEVIIAKGDFVRRMYVIRRGAAEVRNTIFIGLKFQTCDEFPNSLIHQLSQFSEKSSPNCLTRFYMYCII